MNHQEQLPFHSRRSPVFATGGMVASSQPLATEAGLAILKKGGTAADAAIATAAALAVTEPCSTGLGGDAFMLYYDARRKTVRALNGSGRSPAALDLEQIRKKGFRGKLPPYHPHTVTVPGACAAWVDLHQEYGKLSLSEVFSPAIRLAKEGFPVGLITAHLWHREVDKLKKTPGGKHFLIGSRGPKTGEIFQNPQLASVLKNIARKGKPGFYKGKIAASIVRILQAQGGVIQLKDLAEHHSTWEEPISITYKGYRLHECPPNGQGLVALIALNILKQKKLNQLGPALGVDRLHHEIEALRLAFADGHWFIADPELTRIPINKLLSARYVKKRAALIHPDKVMDDPRQGAPLAGSDTVYFCVVDGRGNACSMVNSNYMGFGTGIVPPDAGFSLQNRGHCFSLDPEAPNRLEPGKRPYHTIIPAMITRDRDQGLYGPMGVMGGFMQPQGHLQVFLGLIEDKLNPQEVLDRPRFCLQGGSARGRVQVEDGIEEKVLEQLKKRGHQLQKVSGFDRSVFGRGQIIQRDPKTGVLCAGSDPRADGCALGF
jgi:gamma-glutamyltranspeptidase / glutathione hydrolase